MSAFTTAFIALCDDPSGEALRIRLTARLNNNAGGPGTLMTLTSFEEVLALNPIERKRELEWGVAKGQAWQVQLTNNTHALHSLNLKGCWLAIEGGFVAANEWAIFGQGKIDSIRFQVDGTAVIEVHDSVMDVLKFTLPRNVRFQSTGWIDTVGILAKASGSRGWNTSAAVALNTPAAADDETFILEFTSPNAYKVILEDGTALQTGAVGTDLTIANLAGDVGIITIPAAGWDQNPGAYAVGDRFVFYTARARTTNELTPVYMVQHLIDDIAGLTVYDVLIGSDYASPRYDVANWAARATAATPHTMQGYWRKGTNLSAMIQDALKIVHGAIYPTRTGQIGLWALQPSTTIGVNLNGNPGAGPIDILDRAAVIDSNQRAVSEVTFDYLTLAGEKATVSATDVGTALLEARGVKISTGWEVKGVSAQDACDKYLNRFKDGPREYVIPATLAGATAEIGAGVSITDDELDLSTAVSDVVAVSTDLINNSSLLRAYTDPVAISNYFVLGADALGGTAVLW